MAPLLKALSDHEAHFEVSAQGLLRGDASVVEKLERIFGKALLAKMTDGLRKLSESFDDLSLDEDARLIGPTLEGLCVTESSLWRTLLTPLTRQALVGIRQSTGTCVYWTHLRGLWEMHVGFSGGSLLQ
jgi:hypothetical protein